MTATARFLWIEVGCLECDNPTTFRDVFETLDEAKAAIEEEEPGAKPQVLTEGEQSGHVGGSYEHFILAVRK